MLRDFIIVPGTDGNDRLLNPGFVCRGEVDGKSGAVTLHTMDGAQIPLSKAQWDAIKADFIEVPATIAPADPNKLPEGTPPAA